MERDWGFNFKLLIPSKVNTGHVSAVRPLENVENCDDVMSALQQGYSKFYDKDQSMLFPNTSVVVPTKPAKQACPTMKVMPQMEKDENECNPGQLFSKLFNEVEKIKCWKVQTDSETLQKERRLQENKRTIETQRKAIQELQFGNESLSMKLDEQISDNENLRNENNAIKNLCNILRDTFQQSAEKMHLYESEREETHQLFVENNESIQKLIAAFESLCFQAEADQQEMLKVKENLLQFEDLKKKYNQDCNIKEKEVVALQTKLNDKENEMQKILINLQESQKHCKQLQENTSEQCELLRSSKSEQESLLQELQAAKQSWEKTEKKYEAIAALLEKSKEEYAEVIQSKDLKLEELNRVTIQQAEKQEQIQTTTKELQNSLALETQRTKDLKDELMTNIKELEKRNTLLGEIVEQSAKKDRQIKDLEDDLDKKTKFIDSLKVKLDLFEVRVEELTAELSKTTKEAQLLKSEVQLTFNEKNLLKKACEASEKAKEGLFQKSTMEEIKVQKLEEHLIIERQKNEESSFQVELLRKEVTLHEVKYEELLSKFNELQSEKTAIQQQLERGSSNVKAAEANIKVSEEKALKLTRELQRLESENQCLREEVNTIKTHVQRKHLETEILEKKIEENCEHLQDRITEKENKIQAMEIKLCNLWKNTNQALEYQKENKLLKKQIATEIAKSNQLEIEVEKYRLTAAEVIKNKEETELKCQHKIADMVVLMEKHKGQCDRIVEKKDAELDVRKKKEMEALAHCKSLELDLKKHEKDYNQLKEQLKVEITEKENMQTELFDVKKELSSLKVTSLSNVMKKESPASNCKQGRCPETPKDSSPKKHVFVFSKARITPSFRKDEGIAAIQKKTDLHTADLQTVKMITNRISRTSKIKSYRIRTPPSGREACWKTTTMELDSKSDSSDQTDILSFARAPNYSAPHCQINIVQKTHSPANQKSPGNNLKHAAMKRMRDAGWTAITGCDQKKKKRNSKIFA